MALTNNTDAPCVKLTEKDYPVFERGSKPTMLDVKWDLPMEEEEDEFYSDYDRVHSTCGFRAIFRSLWSSTFGSLSSRRKNRSRRKHAASQQSL